MTEEKGFDNVQIEMVINRMHVLKRQNLRVVSFLQKLGKRLPLIFFEPKNHGYDSTGDNNVRSGILAPYIT